MTESKISRFRGGEPRLEQMRESEFPGGIAVDPLPATKGQEVTVLYYGLLSQNGADGIWIHVGYGDAFNWENVEDRRMEKTFRGWVATFPVVSGRRLHFCFKDSANNWDNNNGWNWSLEVHEGRTQNIL